MFIEAKKKLGLVEWFIDKYTRAKTATDSKEATCADMLREYTDIDVYMNMF